MPSGNSFMNAKRARNRKVMILILIVEQSITQLPKEIFSFTIPP
jgi:hypothetical protein